MLKICLYCGKEFSTRWRNTKFCDDCNKFCYKLENGKYQRIFEQPKKCIVCGKDLQNKQRKYCDECSYIKNHKMIPMKVIENSKERTKCIFCGGDLPPLHKHFCSRKCRYDYYTERIRIRVNKLPPPNYGNCRYCGTPLPAPESGHFRSFCSPKCKHKYRQSLNKKGKKKLERRKIPKAGRESRCGTILSEHHMDLASDPNHLSTEFIASLAGCSCKKIEARK